MPSTALDVDAALVISPEIRRSAVRRHRLAVMGAVLVVLAVGAGIAFRARAKPTQYSATVVERRTITRMVEVSGYLEVTRRVEVAALSPGRLVSVLVRVGETVREGQPLALLDSRAAAIAARSAQASVDAWASRVAGASATAAAATAARTRVERLRARELATESDVDAARAQESEAGAALRTARAERSQAVESLRSAKLAESLTSVAAPISGIVLQAPELTGGAVGPERGPLFVLGSPLESLRIEAEVAESEVGELHPGQLAHFSVPAQPGRTFDARVEHVGVDARRNAVAVRYPVELRTDNPSGLLLPGMTATVQIAVARVEGVLATRDAALRFHPPNAPEAPARSRVWRITPGGLEEIHVVAGVSDGAFTEIRPEPAGALAAGAELALGALAAEPPKASGPGIRLGNR